jgi:hypothetical protein
MNRCLPDESSARLLDWDETTKHSQPAQESSTQVIT